MPMWVTSAVVDIYIHSCEVGTSEWVAVHSTRGERRPEFTTVWRRLRVEHGYQRQYRADMQASKDRVKTSGRLRVIQRQGLAPVWAMRGRAQSHCHCQSRAVAGW